MRLRTAAATVFATAILLGGAASTASAGEINGKGQPVGGEGLGAAHANSICAFSGLEDGDGGGFPGPGGAPPQNWGHSKEFFGATPAERKASGSQPGDSCNGHSGFLVAGAGGTVNRSHPIHRARASARALVIPGAPPPVDLDLINAPSGRRKRQISRGKKAEAKGEPPRANLRRRDRVCASADSGPIA